MLSNSDVSLQPGKGIKHIREKVNLKKNKLVLYYAILKLLFFIRKVFEMFVSLYRKFEHLIKYCCIGCSGACLDFLLYFLLVTYTSCHYQYANILSTSCGILNNFFLNYYFNFKVRDHILIRLLSFYLVGTLGIVITSAMLYCLIERLALSPLISKIITIFVVTAVQFLLNNYLTFRKKKKRELQNSSEDQDICKRKT